MVGKRTNIYTDVKSDVVAGMQFGKDGTNKMRVVGFDIVRLYYDSRDKDYLVGEEKIKRELKY